MFWETVWFAGWSSNQQPSKLCVALPGPIQVAQFVPAISPNLAFLHLQEALQACTGTQPYEAPVWCLLMVAPFTTSTHLNWVTKVEDYLK